MKKCDYCGRDNSDEASHCHECGTEFPLPSDPEEPAQSGDRGLLEWFGLVLRSVGVLLAVGLVYLLSFGPVNRYCRTILPLPAISTIAARGQSSVIIPVSRVGYPRWVSIVYGPALMLRGNVFYERYLRLWEDKP